MMEKGLLNCRDRFVLDEGISFVNHGSYGAVPKCVLDLKQKYELEIERNPDFWYSHTGVSLWFQNRRTVADILGTLPSNLAFVVNSTSGVNAVLSSIVWQEGDVILATDASYVAVVYAMKDVTLRKSIEVRAVKSPLPLENERQLVEAFTSEADALIESGKRPRLAIIDAISSMPAILFPFQEITRQLQQRSVQVFVDGAHIPGHLPDINLETLGADYFVGNIHKWLFCPKGTAILYCSPKHQSYLRAPVVSLDYGKHMSKLFEDPLSARFFEQGTSPNLGFTCVSKAFEFIERVGGLNAVYDYNTSLASKATETILAKVPNASKLPMAQCFTAPFMRNLALPSPNKLSMLQLYDDHSTWLPMFEWRGHFLCRFSCNIYNTLSDYDKLGETIANYLVDSTD